MRKSKLRAKNEKLNEERRKGLEEGEKQDGKAKGAGVAPVSDNEHDIHPSRRTRIIR